MAAPHTHPPEKNGLTNPSDTRVTLPLALLVGAIVGGAWLLFTLWRQDINTLSERFTMHSESSGHPPTIERLANMEARVVAFDARLDAQQAALVEMHQRLLSDEEASRDWTTMRNKDWEDLRLMQGDALARLRNLEDALAILHPRK